MAFAGVSKTALIVVHNQLTVEMGHWAGSLGARPIKRDRELRGAVGQVVQRLSDALNQ
jgi:hypothetical protein